MTILLLSCESDDLDHSFPAHIVILLFLQSMCISKEKFENMSLSDYKHVYILLQKYSVLFSLYH